MSLTNDQLLTRIEIIEDTLNDVQTALNRMITKTQYNSLYQLVQQQLATPVNTTIETRVSAIETTLNSIQTAINNVASKAQLKALLQIRQTEINTLQTKVAALEAEIVTLQTFHS